MLYQITQYDNALGSGLGADTLCKKDNDGWEQSGYQPIPTRWPGMAHG